MTRLLATVDKGFSLVELVIVIAIIGVLATLGTQYSRDARVRAEQVVAKFYLRDLHTRYVTYLQEHERIPGTGSHLQYGNYSTQDSCHLDNFLDFKLPDCRKASYYFSMTVGGPMVHVISAHEIFGEDGSRLAPWRENPHSTTSDCSYDPDLGGLHCCPAGAAFPIDRLSLVTNKGAIIHSVNILQVGTATTGSSPHLCRGAQEEDDY